MGEVYVVLAEKLHDLGEAGEVDIDTGILASAMLLVGLCRVYGGNPEEYLLRAVAGLVKVEAGRAIQ